MQTPLLALQETNKSSRTLKKAANTDLQRTLNLTRPEEQPKSRQERTTRETLNEKRFKIERSKAEEKPSESESKIRWRLHEEMRLPPEERDQEEKSDRILLKATFLPKSKIQSQSLTYIREISSKVNKGMTILMRIPLIYLKLD